MFYSTWVKIEASSVLKYKIFFYMGEDWGFKCSKLQKCFTWAKIEASSVLIYKTVFTWVKIEASSFPKYKNVWRLRLQVFQNTKMFEDWGFKCSKIQKCFLHGRRLRPPWNVLKFQVWSVESLLYINTIQ